MQQRMSIENSIPDALNSIEDAKLSPEEQARAWVDAHLPILKPGEYYCWSIREMDPDRPDWCKREYPFQNNFCQSKDDLIAQALRATANPDNDVFVALATFRKKQRKNTCVSRRRNIAFDFDVTNPGDTPEAAAKKYPTLKDAAAAAFELGAELRVKMSFVKSGRGVHAYVDLDHDYPAFAVKPVADKLKQWALDSGFKIDPAVTGDMSRLMRMAGCVHRKNRKGLAVVMGAVGAPISLSELKGRLNDILTKAERHENPRLFRDGTDVPTRCGLDQVTKNLMGHGPREWTPELESDLRLALKPVPSGGREVWIKVLLCLVPHGENAWPLFDEWSRENDNGGTYDPIKNRAKWELEYANCDRSETGKVATIFNLAKELGAAAHKSHPQAKVTQNQRQEVVFLRASEIKPEPIRWIWDGYLARGKIHILGGAPGVSKTTLAMAVAGTVSSGGMWPDGTKADAGNVLIWSGEDDPKDTLIPRLIANKADMERVLFVDATLDESGQHLPFDPSRDIRRLEQAALQLGGVSLLIVDPIVSAVAGDGNSNNEVRRDLQPLVDFAESLDCAVWGITHFTKGSSGQAAVNRITGSLAFGAVARIIHVCFKNKDPDEHGAVSFMRGKSNISANGGGFFYDIEQILLPQNAAIAASRIKWRNKISGSAEELLAKAEAVEKDQPAADTARDFLLKALANGPQKQKDLMSEARDEGIASATLYRVREAMKIQTDRWGGGAGSVSWWSRADVPWPSDWEQQKNGWAAGKK